MFAFEFPFWEDAPGDGVVVVASGLAFFSFGAGGFLATILEAAFLALVIFLGSLPAFALGPVFLVLAEARDEDLALVLAMSP
jgi:hypothetical protein